MDFKEPFHVYTAEGNIEAHVIAEMLQNNGIEALAVEDQSGVSLWSFGTISQFHRPKVWIEKFSAEAATQLIQEFEQRKRARSRSKRADDLTIEVVCEECGKKSMYPKSQNGTTQDCKQCYATVDVGELDWDEDLGTPED